MSDILTADPITLLQNLAPETPNSPLPPRDIDEHSQSDSDYDVDLFETEEAAHKRQIELQERFLSLQNVVNGLRAQLAQEKALWRKELKELWRCGHKFECCTEYFDDNSECSYDFNAYEYEKRVAEYQDSIARAQAQRRMALQRQMAINNYRQRLLEVENMCNLELLRVKQNVQFLQPLQLIASEWNKDLEKGDGGHNDVKNKLDDDGIVKKEQNLAVCGNNNGGMRIIGANQAVQCVRDKLYNEINEVFNKMYEPISSSLSTSLLYPEDYGVDSSNSQNSAVYLSHSNQNLSAWFFYTVICNKFLN